MKIILFIILFIVFIILSIIVFLLSNRDKIFYFLPKYIHNPHFEKFLKDYNGVKYKCKVDGVDIIDLPPRKNTNKVIVFSMEIMVIYKQEIRFYLFYQILLNVVL